MRRTSRVGRRAFWKRVALRMLCLALAGPPCAAQGTSAFARTGDMTASRSQHTATLLPNGKVLLTGGVSYVTGNYSGNVLASSDLFDPETGTFSASGSMSGGRRMHTATLLSDGRVLIAGGYESVQPLNSAELFDPATGTFTPTGAMGHSRAGHDAFLLSDGTVLVIGGFDGHYPTIPGAEIYDPGTGVFRTAGSMYVGSAVCDFCPPSVMLATGQVLFALQRPAQLFNPLTGAFLPTGEALGWESAATLLMNGRVLFTGGEGLGRSNSAEVYDPVNGTFAATGNMASPRVWHSLTLLPDGTVLTTGGETDVCGPGFCMFGGTVASAETYDPTTGSFAPTNDMNESRSGHSATLLNDGRVLIAGGVGYGGIGVFYGSTSSAELYTPRVPVAALRLVSTPSEARAGDTLRLVSTGIPGRSVIPPQVTIGGRLARVLSFGAPNWPGTGGRLRAGSLTITYVRMPSGVAPGPVALRMSFIGRASNEVTLMAR